MKYIHYTITPFMLRRMKSQMKRIFRLCPAAEGFPLRIFCCCSNVLFYFYYCVIYASPLMWKLHVALHSHKAWERGKFNSFSPEREARFSPSSKDFFALISHFLRSLSSHKSAEISSTFRPFFASSFVVLWPFFSLINLLGFYDEKENSITKWKKFFSRAPVK